MPLGWKAGVAVAVTGAALSAGALGLAEAMPWIGAVGLAALVALLLGLVGWAAFTWKRGGAVATKQWLSYASHVDDRVRKELDRTSRDAQGAAAAAVDHLLRLHRAPDEEMAP